MAAFAFIKVVKRARFRYTVKKQVQALSMHSEYVPGMPEYKEKTWRN